jgi:hypothetical protein
VREANGRRPDKFIDAHIAALCLPPPPDGYERYVDHIEEIDDWWVCERAPGQKGRGIIRGAYGSPTTSVDSALAMVRHALPGWAMPSIYEIEGRRFGASLSGGAFKAFAETMPLAVCAVLLDVLRAQATEDVATTPSQSDGEAQGVSPERLAQKDNPLSEKDQANG